MCFDSVGWVQHRNLTAVVPVVLGVAPKRPPVGPCAKRSRFSDCSDARSVSLAFEASIIALDSLRSITPSPLLSTIRQTASATAVLTSGISSSSKLVNSGYESTPFRSQSIFRKAAVYPPLLLRRLMRSRVGVIPQDSWLFSGTLRSNLDVGDRVGFDGRLIPGAGPVVASLERACGREAVNVGKGGSWLLPLFSVLTLKS